MNEAHELVTGAAPVWTKRSLGPQTRPEGKRRRIVRESLRMLRPTQCILCIHQNGNRDPLSVSLQPRERVGVGDVYSFTVSDV